MMEKSGMLCYKGDPQLLRCFKNRSIVLATCRSGNVFDARPAGPKNVIDEGELCGQLASYAF